MFAENWNRCGKQPAPVGDHRESEGYSDEGEANAKYPTTSGNRHNIAIAYNVRIKTEIYSLKNRVWPTYGG